MSENEQTVQMRSEKQDFLNHLQEEIEEVFHLMGRHFEDQYDMLTIEEYMELCDNRINKAISKMRETARDVIEVPINRLV